MKDLLFHRRRNVGNKIDDNPLVWQVVSFVAGLLAAFLLLPYILVPLSFVFYMLGGVFLLFFVWNVIPRRPFSFDISFFLSLSYSFLFGFFLFQCRYRQVTDFRILPDRVYQAHVEDVPVEGGRTWRMPMRLDDGRLVQVFVSKGRDSVPLGVYIHRGSVVHFSAWSIRYTDPKITEAWRGDERQYKSYYDYLFSRGFSAVCFVNASSLGFNPNCQAASPPASWRAARGHILAYYRSHLPETQAAAVVEAMTMGEKSHLDKSSLQSFSRAGMSHLLALSGFHLGVVVMILNLVLFTSFIYRWNVIASLVVIVPTLWAYTLLVGCPPSLVRASIMCSFYMLCRALRWGGEQRNVLSLALALMLCSDPLLLLDVGMQLSFTAVLGIIFLGLPLCGTVLRKPWYLRLPLSLVFISFSCTFFTVPLVSFHFGYFPLYSIVSNMLSSLLSTVLMWTSVVWWLFTPFASIQEALSSLLLFFSQLLCDISDMVSHWPGSVYPVRINSIGLVSSYIIVVSVTKIINILLSRIKRHR